MNDASTEGALVAPALQHLRRARGCRPQLNVYLLGRGSVLCVGIGIRVDRGYESVGLGDQSPSKQPADGTFSPSPTEPSTGTYAACAVEDRVNSPAERHHQDGGPTRQPQTQPNAP